MSPAITIRPAQAADHARVAFLFLELGVSDPFPRLERWVEEYVPTTLIAERGAVVVGYAYYQLLSGIGYVRNVVSAAEARRTGVGKALMLAMADIFRAHSADMWCLNVLPKNLAAVSLYESLGMGRAYDSMALRIRWRDVEQLPADLPDTVSSAIGAEDDGGLEREFGVASGLFADRRKRGGTLLQTRHRLTGQALGVAAFSPAFPGAFPFRVRSPADGPALLRALAPHALPEHDWLQLVIEGDPQLVAMLTGAGATLLYELVHYRGALSAQPDVLAEADRLLKK